MGSSAAAQSAIQALYGPDSGQRQAANVWLTEYASSEQAWECLQLLQGDLAPEVQFFSINLILSKVRHAWRQLQSEARQQVQSFVRTKLDERVRSPANRLITQRICLLLAAMAAADGAEAGAVLLNHALQLTSDASNASQVLHLAAQAAPEPALDLLLSMAEEAAALDTKRQGLFVKKGMQPQASAVLSILGKTLQSCLAAPGQASTTALSLRCIQAWLGLTLTDSHSQSLCSPGALQKHQSQLFTSLCTSTSAMDPVVLDAAAETFEVMLESEEGGVQEEADMQAMSAIAQALIATKDTLQGGEVETNRARLVAKVAAAMADRTPEGVALTVPEAVPLAELIMTCLSLGQRQVAEFAIDYLDSLSTVPLAERHPQLRQPLYSSLLQVLFAHIQFPQGFTTWEDWVEDDEEAFHRFREQSLQEVLEICYGVSRSPYLAALIQHLQYAACWQSAEAALFGIRCVSSSVLESSSVDSQDQSEEGRHQQNTRALLSSLFGQLCSGQGHMAQSGLLQQPWVVATAARLVGDYALWFSNLGGPEVPLEAALQLLLQALRVPQAASAAAKAFRGLCIRCAARLTNPADVQGLIGIAHTALQTSATSSPGVAIDFEDQQNVMEGLARVTALLPAPEAAKAGQHLIGPFLQAAQADIQSNPGSSQNIEQMAANLQLVACAIRSMEFGSTASPTSGRHPVVTMFEASQPVLAGIAQIPSLQASGPVVSGLCEVYRSVLTCLRKDGEALLQAVAPPCLTLFQAHQHPPCLEVLASCVFYFAAAPAAAPLLTHALYVACSASEPLFQQASHLASRQEHLTSLYRLADNCVLMAPGVAQASGALPSLFRWVVAALQLREAEPLRCVISFLTHWAAPSSGLLTDADKQALKEALHSCMSHQGRELVQALALALLQTCPRHLLRSLAAPLRALLEDSAMSDAVKSSFSQMVCSQQYIEVSGGTLDPDSCQLFCRLAMQRGTLSLHRFSALLQDFGSLARGEGTSDVLLAYEL